MEYRLGFDIFSAVLLLLTALGGAWLPRYLAAKSGGVEVVAGSASSVAFHLGNMLSGGVMLSAGFCHLLADALRHLSFVGRFPMAPFLAAVGYIITLTADQFVQAVAESSSGGGSSGSDPAPHWGSYVPLSEQRGAHRLRSPPTTDGGADGDAEAPPLRPLRDQKDGVTSISSRIGKANARRSSPSPTRVRVHANGSPRSLLPANGVLSSSSDGTACANGATHVHGGSSPSGPERNSSPESAHGMEDGVPSSRAAQHLELDAARGHDHHAPVQLFLAQKQLPFATAVLLALALCIHSMLEGIALGAQTSMRDTEDIMIAILAHKGLAAYALGASIVESKASATKFWTVIGLFASATPLGIFIGYATSNIDNGAVSAAMSALASGTFLYVAMMEVIPKELEIPHYRVAKMGALLLGFGLMSMLAIWA